MTATPFSVDFNVSAHDGSMWIKPWWGPRSSEVPLHLKGVNWFGASGSRWCMEEINKVPVQSYIDFMTKHGFNAVRLPLAVGNLLSNPLLGGPVWPCKEYAGWHHVPMLVDVAQRLSRAGIFLMLDMHNMGDGGNQAVWCSPHNETLGCTDSDLTPLLNAWTLIADTFCSHRNVIMVDLFK